MKRAVSLALQFLVFFLVFLGGTLLDPFHLRWFITHPSSTSVRYFVPDGLILMVLLYAFFLVFELLMNRLRQVSAWTSASFALALVLGLLSKFGMATHDLY